MNRRDFMASAGVLMVPGALKLPAAPGAEPAEAAGADLSGTWDFRFDPNDQGERQRWFADSGKSGWDRSPVPMSFNVVFPDERWYSGAAWYRTEFEAPKLEPGEGLQVRFLSVALRARVWVNGLFVGEHLFPYSAFTLDITHAIRPGQTNHLVVRADNRILRRAIPDLKHHGWWNFGGILREVYIERRPVIDLEDVLIQTEMPGAAGAPSEVASAAGKKGWRLRYTLTCHNYGPSRYLPIHAAVEDASGQVLWQKTSHQVLVKGITHPGGGGTFPNITPWSPEHPALYTLVVRGPSGTEHRTRFGFRQIGVRGTEILLNGEPVFLRGINRHELFPGRGMTPTPEEERSDLEDIKALGCNFVRLCHYQQHPRVYDLADELGLLLWSEIPAWQSSRLTLSDPEVWRVYGAPQLREMILQNRNHPSVMFWSVANEVPSETTAVRDYIDRAAAYVKEIDPSRLVSFASSRRLEDICFDAVDVIAVNEYCGWYYGKMSDVGPLLDDLHRKWPHKPIVVSEFGAGCARGRKPAVLPARAWDYSEDYQVELLRSHLSQILAPERSGYVAGSMIWVYNDFPDPARIAPSQPSGHPFVNLKGIVTQHREKKRSYSVVQKMYRAHAAREKTG
jgi:beta-glucuronidase